MDDLWSLPLVLEAFTPELPPQQQHPLRNLHLHHWHPKQTGRGSLALNLYWWRYRDSGASKKRYKDSLKKSRYISHIDHRQWSNLAAIWENWTLIVHLPKMNAELTSWTRQNTYYSCYRSTNTGSKFPLPSIPFDLPVVHWSGQVGRNIMKTSYNFPSKKAKYTSAIDKNIISTKKLLLKKRNTLHRNFFPILSFT